MAECGADAGAGQDVVEEADALQTSKPEVDRAAPVGRDPWDSFYDGPSPSAPGAPGGWAPRSHQRTRGMGRVDGGPSSGPAAVAPEGMPHSRSEHSHQSGYRSGPLVSPDGPVNDERLSHLLGKTLRYHALDKGLLPNEDGYVKVSDVLAIEEFDGASEEDVRRVATTSMGSKGARFEVLDDEDAGGLFVRAKYRHAADGGHRRRDRDHRDENQGHRSHNRHNARPSDERGFRPNKSGGATEGSHEVKSRGYSSRYAPSSVYPRESDPERSEWSEAVDWSTPSVSQALDNPDEVDPWKERKSNNTQGAESAGSKTISSSENRDEDDSVDLAWELYHEPGTDRAWYWNSKTEEVFYADDETSGWEQYYDPNGSPWWYHEASGRFFYEEEEK